MHPGSIPGEASKTLPDLDLTAIVPASGDRLDALQPRCSLIAERVQAKPLPAANLAFCGAIPDNPAKPEAQPDRRPQAGFDEEGAASMLDHAQARQLMVDCQLRTFDVNDVPLLDAFATVPRERYVQPGAEDFAYIDRALRLGTADGEVRMMPPPMIMARMIQALRLRPGARVLDVGAAYGYAAALLAQLKARVVALESVPALAGAARERLAGIAEVVEGPLGDGASAQAPFDAILVEGRVETRPQSLLDQLAEDGRLVCVFGPDRGAKATLYVRAGNAISARPLFDAALPALKAFAVEHAFAF